MDRRTNFGDYITPTEGGGNKRIVKFPMVSIQLHLLNGNIFISRQLIGPGQEIIKHIRSISLSVRPAFLKFYKKLSISFNSEEMLSNCAHNIYNYKDTHVINFQPHSEKQEGRHRCFGFFPSFFFTVFLLCYRHSSQLFRRN